MKIIFSTSWSAISKECGAKFPTYTQENAAKHLLFARLRDAGRTPVRFISLSGDEEMYDLLVDVPNVTYVEQVAAEVLPFTCFPG